MEADGPLKPHLKVALRQWAGRYEDCDPEGGESLDNTAELPATYYADRPTHERVRLMVEQWRKLVPLAEQLQEQRDSAQAKIAELEAKLARE